VSIIITITAVSLCEYYNHNYCCITLWVL